MQAQTNVGSIVPAVDSTYLAKLTGEFFYESKQYVGEQYFNENWTPGDILLSTGEMIYDASIKYNGFFDAVIWLNTHNYGKFKLDKSFVREFWLKDEQGPSIHFKKIDMSDSVDNLQSEIFVEVCIEGNISLYIQRKISVVGYQTQYIDNTYQKFELIEATPVYYIKLPSTNYLKLNKINRRTFLKLFPEKKKAINKIIRSNHLDVSIESGIVEVIELMDKELF